MKAPDLEIAAIKQLIEKHLLEDFTDITVEFSDEISGDWIKIKARAKDGFMRQISKYYTVWAKKFLSPVSRGCNEAFYRLSKDLQDSKPING